MKGRESFIFSIISCQATLLVADANNSFELTGNGDVLEPEGGVVAIGSGGSYALGIA